MATKGDSFCVTLEKAHLEWGNHRHTESRTIIYGEGYIRIPRQCAKQFCVYNSKNNGDQDVLGSNIFNCSSVDGFFTNASIKAAGNPKKNDIYAKQFQGNGNLQLFGDWFEHTGAKVGDEVEVTWTSSNDILIELIKK